MAKPMVFVDTSGFYALFVRTDSMHEDAQANLRRLRENGSRAFTTDYVLDETLTLFKARGVGHLSPRLCEVVDASEALALHFVGEDRFRKSRAYFERHSDPSYSFTDCTSFVVMREFGAVEALTKDEHFREAGFRALLLES